VKVEERFEEAVNRKGRNNTKKNPDVDSGAPER
jgi:hypothetical protein